MIFPVVMSNVTSQGVPQQRFGRHWFGVSHDIYFGNETIQSYTGAFPCITPLPERLKGARRLVACQCGRNQWRRLE